MLELDLKNDIKDSFQKILSETIEENPSPYQLTKEIDAFEKEVEARRKSLDSSWLDTAAQLISEARSFVEILKGHEQLPHKVYLKAAIRYLVNRDDVLSDFDSADGLKDDAFLFYEIMHGLRIEELVGKYHKHKFKLSS